MTSITAILLVVATRAYVQLSGCDRGAAHGLFHQLPHSCWRSCDVANPAAVTGQHGGSKGRQKVSRAHIAVEVERPGFRSARTGAQFTKLSSVEQVVAAAGARPSRHGPGESGSSRCLLTAQGRRAASSPHSNGTYKLLCVKGLQYWEGVL